MIHIQLLNLQAMLYTFMAIFVLGYAVYRLDQRISALEAERKKEPKV